MIMPIVILLGVDANAVLHAVLRVVRAGEELSDVAQLSPGGGDSQVIAIFGFEGFHFGGIFEEVLAVCPTYCVAFGRVSPVFAAANRVFAVELQGGGGDGVLDVAILP